MRSMLLGVILVLASSFQAEFFQMNYRTAFPLWSAILAIGLISFSAPLPATAQENQESIKVSDSPART